MSDSDEPIPALFATIHHRSEERPNGYTAEDMSWLNVQANRHIPDLYASLAATHRARFPTSDLAAGSDYSIGEHSHRFAAWAASRAASVKKYRFSVSVGKHLLEAIGCSGNIQSPDDLPHPDLIDDLHYLWREDMIRAAHDLGISISHGIAAKLINVYFKARFVSGPTAYHPNVASLHPPIDSVLLKELALQKFGGSSQPWRDAQKRAWSNFTSAEYEDIIANLRTHLKGRPLWTIEQYWRGYQ